MLYAAKIGPAIKETIGCACLCYKTFSGKRAHSFRRHVSDNLPLNWTAHCRANSIITWRQRSSHFSCNQQRRPLSLLRWQRGSCSASITVYRYIGRLNLYVCVLVMNVCVYMVLLATIASYVSLARAMNISYTMWLEVMCFVIRFMC